jgi:hypothetical protein
MGIGTLLGFALFFVLVAVLLKRGSKAEPAKVAERSAVDKWVEETLAREVARKGKAHGDELLAALRGDPEPHVVTAVEEAVKGVKLQFSRQPRDGEYEVRVEIAFEEGDPTTSAKTFSRDALPTTIQDEFVRTGGAYVFREWHFPWYSADRWS